MLTCNGELGKPGFDPNDSFCSNTGRKNCPGCSVCHGNCETCGGTGHTTPVYDVPPPPIATVRFIPCTNYQPAKGG